ncbi:single-stranded DNA-binding protein [Nocardioides alcanivorans]|uniref:single-stranded DNA-binding protein n=1 Tax=Nocardioides alcanivorans TaxID=2897352 RepID=UPI001F46C3B8|nr:single-stranded DNA-binding protein [Nocardioides alcanivorans]
MNESYVNICGYLGNEVETRMVGELNSVATFRVASTPRRWSAKEREWVDAATNWYTVNAWRTLGRNCADSLKKGDAVTIYGKLSTQVWRDENGNDRQTMVVDAAYVGHDLNRGCSTFVRSTAESVDPGRLAAANGALGVGGPQMSSDGKVLADMVEGDSDDTDDHDVARAS